MKPASKIFTHIDWLLLGLYASLVIFGWFNIHAVSYEKELDQSLFDLSRSAGRQFIWIMTTSIIFCVAFLLDSRTYQAFAYVFYAFVMLLLLGTLVWGISVGGHRAWLPWGGQPSELAKLACALAIAKYLGSAHIKLTQLRPQFMLLGIILFPVAIILVQGDAGSGLVFVAFVIVLYREGLSPWLLLIGGAIVLIFVLTLLVPRLYLVIGTLSLSLLLIGLVRRTLKTVLLVILVTLGTLVSIEGFHLFVGKLLKPHQQNRLKALVDPNVDPLGIGWNVTQSKIAIGSGGLWGKGFLQGTQTKYGFVPEQRTDFIFCTIGEEHGWMGALLVISLFLGLISRICYLAERQRLRFARVYGYAVASILFFHFMINIGMTIGLMPVIGIPLPFTSYGGSSLWSFSLMLFILLKLDAQRQDYVSRRQAPILD
ncbi:MAG: rod shape-determining protein RodA [Bacteroidota bacterium]